MGKILKILTTGLLVLIFFIPEMASCNWGKKKIENHLEGFLGGRVSIEKVSLSWLGKQQCHGVRWISEKKQSVLSADSINIAANMFNCIRYNEKPLNVSVEGAKISHAARERFFKQVTLEFSPIEAMIQKGVVTFERTEVNLSKSKQVITWGRIDLLENHMDVIIGLPPKILKKLFNMDNLPEDFLLEIPISSKVSMPALEKKLFSYFFKNHGIMLIK